MKNVEKDCVGYCPKCNSSNINWGDSGVADDVYVYEAVCNDCGTSFSEEYVLEYNISYYTK